MTLDEHGKRREIYVHEEILFDDVLCTWLISEMDKYFLLERKLKEP